jgi:FkbM family methyltransferase
MIDNMNIWLDGEKVCFISGNDFKEVELRLSGPNDSIVYSKNFNITNGVSYWIIPDFKSYLKGFKLHLYKGDSLLYKSEMIYDSTFHGEFDTDKVIRETFFPDYDYKGTMVEIGAGPPVFFSMSKHFRDSGWRCICVDPNPKFVEQHKEMGNEIYQYACSFENIEKSKFQIYDSGIWADELEGISNSAISLVYKTDWKYIEIDIQIKTLDSILEEAGVESVDFVSIDTEGWELEVMMGFNLEKYNPSVILLENVSHLNVYNSYMKVHGYILNKKLEYNYIYVKQKL